MIKKFLKIVFLSICVLLLALLFLRRKPSRTVANSGDIKWGVVFSKKFSSEMGLDWKENYLALLDDLKIKRIKVISYWDMIEQKPGQYYFDDLDWQIQEAAKRDVQVLLVVGMKTPRWPECHVPEWANNLSEQEQQEEILKLIEQIVLRYKNVQSPALNNVIWGWQVENEPFFPFGNCPWTDKKFVIKEIALVHQLDDKNRPVFTTESGEAPLWVQAASVGDMVCTSLYKKVWVHQLGIYVYYPFPEVFYYRKIKMIEKLFHKKVICGELQAEPWGPRLLYDISLEEMAKTMNLEQFKNITGFASRTGFDEIYLWGAEWWLWMKGQGHPEIWDEARILFE